MAAKNLKTRSGKRYPDRIARIVRGLDTHADKIRALAKAGYARADIARALQVRYQQVYNVLSRGKGLSEEGEAYAEQPPAAEMLQVGPDGRLVIPVAYRRRLGVEQGGPVQIRFEDGEVRLIGRDEALRRLQAYFSRFARKGISLSEELIAERRAEAAREDNDGFHRS